MGLFEHWPYTNFHELNLDWIVKKVKELSDNWNSIDQIIDDKLEDIDTDVYALITSKPVNVLTLGVKNDGSEDCSAIINTATVTNELYFPAGVYRVDNPLKLHHSIYGCGNDSDFTRLGLPLNGSTIKSNINASSVDGVIEISERHCNIVGLNVQCNSDESGIIINTTITDERCKLMDLTIYNLGNAYGIDCSPSGPNSRILDAHNINIFGRGLLSNSTGIRINEYAYDSVLMNICINAVKRGIINYSFVTVTNCHIWTGALVSDIDPSWWPGTIAIAAHAQLNLSQVYTDTAHVHYYIDTNESVTINGATCWNTAGQTGGCNTADQTVLYITDTYKDKIILFVDGMLIKNAGLMGSLSTNYNGRLGGYIRNVHVISDSENVPDDPVLGVVGRLYSNDAYTQHTENGKYYEIAAIANRYGGCAVIDVLHGNRYAKLFYQRGSTPRMKKVASYGSALNCYYKEVTDGSGRSYIKVYALATNEALFMNVSRMCSGAAYMTSYNSSRTTGERLMPEVLTSADGLTLITE